MDLPLKIKPRWRGHTDADGKWRSEWPSFICIECGAPFEGVHTRRYCSERCKNALRNRANNHAGRRRERARSFGLPKAKYDQVGKFELMEAFGGLCGYCGEPVAFTDLLVGHVRGIEHGGQHTRANIALMHRDCETDWNRVQRAQPS